MKIKATEENKRIDLFLGQELAISRSKINRLIKAEKIIVNGKPVKSSYLLNLHDIIEILDFDEEKHEIIPENIPLDIVYEDEHLVVVNKPKGMVVHPGAGNKRGTLANALAFHFKNLSQIDKTRPGIVHRLDADTSGLLIVAKTDQVHHLLTEQLMNKEISRIYYALVWGVIKNDTGTIEAPIGRDLKNRQKYTVTSLNSKAAITHFRVLERMPKASLLEVELATGRTHQIRVHMQYINYPVVNDPVYGKRQVIDNSGQCLHAKKIIFKHPISLKEMTFECNLAKEFENILKILSGGEKNAGTTNKN